MPSYLAISIYFSFIIILLFVDIKNRPKNSATLWIPIIWMFIIGSRSIGQWMGFEGAYQIDEGSLIDRVVLSLLILAAIIIVLQRKVDWKYLITENKSFTILLLYSLISISWSDYPFIAFKRYIKEIGNFLMILVIITEIDVFQAICTCIRRCFYVLIPLSVLLIKYYPQIGRQFDNWSGLAQNVGATTSKNMLGNLCLLACLYIVWEFLEKKSDKENSIWKIKLVNFPVILYVIMSFWLFSLAKSATSFVCFLIGATIFIISRTAFIRHKPNFIILILLTSFAAFIFLESIFGLSYQVIELIGRDPTLTGRLELWHDLLSFNINAIFGAGYDSFWLGERLKEMWENYWWKPTGAHNGYLETYLNLGSIGLIIIFVVIFSAFYKAKKNLSDKNKFGSFQLGIIVVSVLYNITESAFKGNILVWFVFLMIAIEHGGLRKLQYNEK